MGNITRQDRINLHKNRSGISAGKGTLENLTEGIPQFRTEIDHKTGRQKTVQYIKNGLDVVKSEFKNVDDTGSTIPVISGYPAFAVNQSADSDNQEIESGAFELLVLDEKIYDNGGNFSTGNYSFTAPINGIYHFNARIFWDGNATSGGNDDGDWAAGDYHQISLSKNDRASTPTDQNDFIAQARHTIQGTVSDVYLSNNVISDAKLDAGDYVSVAVKHVTAAGQSQYTYAPTNVHLWSSLTGHLVCAL
tara:strand:+ start:756 stop:1502 length:747 start_codon:yes stop_codon:yes gene_type:complete